MSNTKFTSFEDSCKDIAMQISEVVISKQRDYGSNNILKFGEKGVIVRLSDKIERAKNLLWDNNKPNNESIEDTFIDIAGYAIIQLMLIDGSFTNKLEDK